MTDRDRRLLTRLLLIPALLLAGLYLSGQSFFWGDLTYLNHPWRTLPAEMIQRGMPPLWDPYAYLGMPMAAQLQSGVWYPGSLPFMLFPFVSALPLFYAAHFILIALFGFLWLRAWRLSSSASLAGAAVFMANGVLISHIPFLQQFSVLSFMPAFLLFSRNAWLLGLALALGFLAGYPTMLIGAAAAAFLMVLICGGKRGFSMTPWVCAAAFGAGLSALLLFPAAQLAEHSQRGVGLDMEQIFQFEFSLSDLKQFLGPVIVQSGHFSPAINWWKTSYVGLAAAIMICRAPFRLRRRTAALLVLFIETVVLLLLGDSTGPSHWLWTHLGPLRYIRFPGNLAYLTIPSLALLAAVGFHRHKYSALGACLVIAELTAYGLAGQPAVLSGYFGSAGPLVRRLQSELDGHRYLIGPQALLWHQGAGKDATLAVLDLKHRLYGLTNLPYHLSSIGNFGEPLVPLESYRFMDFVYQCTLDQAADYLSWADAPVALTRDRIDSKFLAYSGRNLWHEYRNPQASGRAVWFDPETGSKIPAASDLSSPPPVYSKGRLVDFRRDREDRFHAQGKTASGWLFLSEPKVSGWKLWLNHRSAQSVRALGVFQKIPVPGGEWRLDGLYDPFAWKAGLMTSLVFFLAIAAYWYNQLIHFSGRKLGAADIS